MIGIHVMSKSPIRRFISIFGIAKPPNSVCIQIFCIIFQRRDCASIDLLIESLYQTHFCCELEDAEMNCSSQPDFRTTELDPDILSTPFRIQTNWHVITGAACSGKTTLIDQLADKGFHTAPEVARQYIEKELAKGRMLDEIRQDRATFTCQVYDMMVESERVLRAGKVTFLDRALPDGFAFYRFAGMNPNEILPDCFQNRYASVFLLNRLPYHQDGVRAADDTTADYFDEWTERDYSSLGYKVIRVPVLSLAERLGFVLEKLSGQ
jgi:predicted ATPase